MVRPLSPTTKIPVRREEGLWSAELTPLGMELSPPGPGQEAQALRGSGRCRAGGAHEAQRGAASGSPRREAPGAGSEGTAQAKLPRKRDGGAPLGPVTAKGLAAAQRLTRGRGAAPKAARGQGRAGHTQPGPAGGSRDPERGPGHPEPPRGALTSGRGWASTPRSRGSGPARAPARPPGRH